MEDADRGLRGHRAGCPEREVEPLSLLPLPRASDSAHSGRASSRRTTSWRAGAIHPTEPARLRRHSGGRRPPHSPTHRANSVARRSPADFVARSSGTSVEFAFVRHSAARRIFGSVLRACARTRSGCRRTRPTVGVPAAASGRVGVRLGARLAAVRLAFMSHQRVLATAGSLSAGHRHLRRLDAARVAGATDTRRKIRSKHIGAKGRIGYA